MLDARVSGNVTRAVSCGVGAGVACWICVGVALDCAAGAALGAGATGGGVGLWYEAFAMLEIKIVKIIKLFIFFPFK